MEALHRIAGVHDPTDAIRSNTDSPAPQPVSNFTTRSELDESSPHSQTFARASLPLAQKSSRPSLSAGRETEDGGLTPTTPRAITTPSSLPPSRQTNGLPAQIQPYAPSSRDINDSHRDPNTVEEEGEFAWGPTHPCFPHPNPHCLPNSPEARSTRVIRVRRDWLATGDRCPQFANLYPEILDPWVSDEDFRNIISTLNTVLEAALDPMTARAWIDAIMGVATGFLWDDFGLTGSKGKIKSVDAFVEKWNADRARAGQEVRLMPLRRTGFMTLDFVIPDPGFDGERPAESERNRSSINAGVS